MNVTGHIFFHHYCQWVFFLKVSCWALCPAHFLINFLSNLFPCDRTVLCFRSVLWQNSPSFILSNKTFCSFFTLWQNISLFPFCGKNCPPFPFCYKTAILLRSVTKTVLLFHSVTQTVPLFHSVTKTVPTDFPFCDTDCPPFPFCDKNSPVIFHSVTQIVPLFHSVTQIVPLFHSVAKCPAFSFCNVNCPPFPFCGKKCPPFPFCDKNCPLFPFWDSNCPLTILGQKLSVIIHRSQAFCGKTVLLKWFQLLWQNCPQFALSMLLFPSLCCDKTLIPSSSLLCWWTTAERSWSGALTCARSARPWRMASSSSCTRLVSPSSRTGQQMALRENWNRARPCPSPLSSAPVSVEHSPWFPWQGSFLAAWISVHIPESKRSLKSPRSIFYFAISMYPYY